MDTKMAPDDDARNDSSLWRVLCERAATFFIAICVIAASYTLLAGIIYILQRIGDAADMPALGVLGLAIDVAILGGAMVLLRRMANRPIARATARTTAGNDDQAPSFAVRIQASLSRRSHAVESVLGQIIALLAVILLFAIGDFLINDSQGGFWSLRNLRTVAVQTSTVAVAALGMTVIIIAGGIDLSAGTALALCATVLARLLDDGYSISTALAGCVAAGAMTGLINGTLISALRVVPFIITLGAMTAFLGVAKIIAKDTTVRPPLEAVPAWLPAMVRPVPEWEWLAWPLLPNFGWGVWLALALAVVLAAVLHYTVFGRHVFALGSNEATARLCGVNVPLTKVAVYTLAGAFVAMAGVYQFARLSTGNPTSGLGLELKIIAAVVIGGGSLNGGRGSIVGTLTGAAIMLVIASGCTSLGLTNPIQDIIIGVIIVAAVTLDQFRMGRLGRG